VKAGVTNGLLPSRCGCIIISRVMSVYKPSNWVGRSSFRNC
jgi:hypothetical protein